MDKLIQNIGELADKIDLEKRFNWDNWTQDLLKSELFSKDEKNRILEQQSGFIKNIELKKVLHARFKNKAETDLAFWYIQKWGGIANFKEKNLAIVNSAIDKSSKKEYLTSLQSISSLSKITSIVDIENQVIYDSRVIYAFNWLILKRFGGNLKFFPIPEGRSSIASNFDIGTIINFKFHKRYEEKDLYFEPKQAYQQFCKIIKLINSAVYPNYKNEPFRLEMLLFSAFDKEIINDMKECIKIDI